MRAALLVPLLLAGGCADKKVGFPEPMFDAGVRAPRDGEVTDPCELTMLKGDPTTECTAIWGCPVRGLFLLGCGDNGQGSIVCVCLQNEDEAVTIDAVPSTCSDETAIRDFARINCGWSWL